MIERDCQCFGISEAGIRLQQELNYLYKNLSRPQPWQPPAQLWQKQDNKLLADVHYKAQSSFFESTLANSVVAKRGSGSRASFN